MTRRAVEADDRTESAFVEEETPLVTPGGGVISPARQRIYRRRAQLDDDEMMEWFDAGLGPYDAESFIRAGLDDVARAAALKRRGISGGFYAQCREDGVDPIAELERREERRRQRVQRAAEARAAREAALRDTGRLWPADFLQVRAGDVAELSGKESSFVAQWRRRKRRPFPAPITRGRNPSYPARPVLTWLREEEQPLLSSHEPRGSWYWRLATVAIAGTGDETERLASRQGPREPDGADGTAGARAFIAALGVTVAGLCDRLPPPPDGEDDEDAEAAIPVGAGEALVAALRRLADPAWSPDEDPITLPPPPEGDDAPRWDDGAPGEEALSAFPLDASTSIAALLERAGILVEAAHPWLSGMLRPALGRVVPEPGPLAAAVEGARRALVEDASPIDSAGDPAGRTAVQLVDEGLFAIGSEWEDQTATPWPVAALMARLVPDRAASVIDPACGEAEILSQLADLRSSGGHLALAGIEIDPAAAQVAELRLLLRGYRAELHQGNAFARPFGGRRFDVVVADPPMTTSPARVERWLDAARDLVETEAPTGGMIVATLPLSAFAEGSPLAASLSHEDPFLWLRAVIMLPSGGRGDTGEGVFIFSASAPKVRGEVYLRVDLRSELVLTGRVRRQRRGRLDVSRLVRVVADWLDGSERGSGRAAADKRHVVKVAERSALANELMDFAPEVATLSTEPSLELLEALEAAWSALERQPDLRGTASLRRSIERYLQSSQRMSSPDDAGS